MRVAVLASGGKDSTLALHHVLKEGYEVAYLATMIPLKEDSWMFHYPNIHLMDLYAEAVGIPVVKHETEGVKDEEVEDLRRLIESLDVKGIVSGAIASNYQKNRIDDICRQLKLESITPLWHKDPLEILREMMRLEFNVIITGVFAHGLDDRWLGKKIDLATVDDLVKLNRQYGVSIVGEGGEYETLVLDAAFFKKRIKIIKTDKVWKGQNGYFLVSEAQVESK